MWSNLPYPVVYLYKGLSTMIGLMAHIHINEDRYRCLFILFFTIWSFRFYVKMSVINYRYSYESSKSNVGNCWKKDVGRMWLLLLVGHFCWVVYGKACSWERTLKDSRLDYVLKAILDVIMGSVLKHNSEGLSIEDVLFDSCTCTSLLQTSNLKWQSLWFAIFNWKKQFLIQSNIQNCV